MKKRDIAITLVLVTVLAVVLLVDNNQRKAWKEDIINTQGSPPRVGSAAPDFQAKDSSSQLFSALDYRGESVVVILWSTGCSFSLDLLADLSAELEDFAVPLSAMVAIGIQGSHAEAEREFRDREISFTPLLDHQKQTKWSYKASILPATYIIAPDGTISFRQSGYSPEILQNIINRITSQ